MSKKSTRIQTAKETLDIIEKGFYTNRKGEKVEIGEMLNHSVQNSILYRPESPLLRRGLGEAPTIFEVTNETTLYAAKRLIDSGFGKVLALNFASAKNPGGGFANGAQAQEESLARASGLYATLVHNWDMYEVNRGTESCLYTDHMIYSPHVPVFRDDDDELLDEPYLLSFITAPAVNAGVVRQRTNQSDIDRIDEVMLTRTEKVLSVAAFHGYNALVLGAWGCGVFRNNPTDVAEYFRYHLVDNPTFRGVFEKIIFAVLDYSADEGNIRPFREVFSV